MIYIKFGKNLIDVATSALLLFAAKAHASLQTSKRWAFCIHKIKTPGIKPCACRRAQVLHHRSCIGTSRPLLFCDSAECESGVQCLSNQSNRDGFEINEYISS